MRSAGAILLHSVPATIITSDWRGEARGAKAIGAVLDNVFPVKWGSKTTREDSISFQDGPKMAEAKLASGFAKPRGVFVLTAANWDEVMGPQPVTALWGIGVKTGRKLEALGIRRVEQLAVVDETMMAAEFGPNTGPWIRQLGIGEDDAEVSDAPHVARGQPRGDVLGNSSRSHRSSMAPWRGTRKKPAAITASAAAQSTIVRAETAAAVSILFATEYYSPFTPGGSPWSIRLLAEALAGQMLPASA